jgi:hypothetical protein
VPKPEGRGDKAALFEWKNDVKLMKMKLERKPCTSLNKCQKTKNFILISYEFCVGETGIKIQRISHAQDHSFWDFSNYSNFFCYACSMQL